MTNQEKDEDINVKRVIDAQEKGDDQLLDIALRPKRLADFVGQDNIKANLGIFIEAAKKRGEPIEHVLLYGPPGLGKTTLAHIIANESNGHIRITAGPALERSGDLAAILTNLQDGDILFIDEIHRLNKNIEEVLYPAMEEYALNLIIGKGPSARTLKLDLPKFTIIGATTKVNMLSSPLRDRFGTIYRLNFYENSDLEKIVGRSANILGIDLTNQACQKIASRARRTPRIANRLLKRVRDYAEVKANGQVTPELTDLALAMLDIDEAGLDQIDRRLLEIIIDKFNGGPVGLNTIAASLGEEMETIEEVYEPFLMQLGFLDRTARGRLATKSAYEHLNKKIPSEMEEKMLW